MQNVYTNFFKAWVSENCAISLNEVDIDADMFESGYIDSIGIFTLFILIEEEFQIEMSLEELEGIDILTIKNLSKVIEYEKTKT